MKILRNQKGITLIALVVTIIVLLILAGVSLQLIGGSSGILNRATGAVDKNNVETGKEQVDLKIAEYKNDFHEEKYVERSLENDVTAKEYLVKKIQEEGNVKLNGYGFSMDEDEKIQLFDQKNGKKFLLATGSMTEEGIIVWDEEVDSNAPDTPDEPEVPEKEIGSADEITMDFYGKYVTNYDDSGHWQIFFTDLENIYLIYDDVIADPVYNEYTLTSAVDSGVYAEGTSMLKDEERFPGYEWNYSSKLIYYSRNEISYQAYLFMMDSENVWNNVYLTNYSDYAIATPTPEMIKQGEGVPRVRETNFKNEGTWGYHWGTVVRTGKYSPPIDNGKSYWLSAPKYSWKDQLYFIETGKWQWSWQGLNNSLGFRPVVKLKSSVVLDTSDGGETYQIQ